MTDIPILIGALLVILLGAEPVHQRHRMAGHKPGLAVEPGIVRRGPTQLAAPPGVTRRRIAILFGGGAAADEVGIGAILGAPFMLATLAMFVTGVAILANRRSRKTGEVLAVSGPVLVHDMRYFAVAYGLAIAVAFIPADLAWPRYVAAAVLLVIYGIYVREHFQADATDALRTCPAPAPPVD
jgi:cation:H+ antiporter